MKCSVWTMCEVYILVCCTDSPGSRRRKAETVVIHGCKEEGLGIRIVGGQNMALGDSKESDFGIFIKEILPGRLAERDGKYISQDKIQRCILYYYSQLS